MQTSFDYDIVNVQKLFNVKYCSVETDVALDFLECKENVVSLYITPFDDLRESLIESTRHNIHALVVEQFDVISLCELIANVVSQHKKLEIAFVIYDNFEVARKNIINVFPYYSENESLMSHILLEKFTAYKRMIFCIFSFQTNFELKNYAFKDSRSEYSREVEYEINEQFVNSVSVNILKLK